MKDFILLFINNEVISSLFQTSNWRNNQLWYKNSISCENFQVETIEKLLKIKLSKTNERLNYINEIISESYPFKYKEGLEYSENFDRKFKINKKIFYFNFKMICSLGGNQTRSIKDVYNFILKQIENLKKNKNIYFINILDGEYCFKFKHCFEYLKNKGNNNLFIGDSRDFIFWYNLNFL